MALVHYPYLEGEKDLRLLTTQILLVTTLFLTACSLGVDGQSPEPGQESPDYGPTLLSAFPTPWVCQAGVIEQEFQYGRMFWVGATIEERCRETHEFLPGSGEIWVLVFTPGTEGGVWLVFADEWDSQSQPESDPQLTPLPGLLQPVRGFGWVWRERLSADQREALGWASGLEFAYSTQYRYESGGSVDIGGQFTLRPGQHVLYDLAGGIFFFDESTQTFDYVPVE